MEKKDEDALRARAAQTVCGDGEYPGAVIARWVRTGEEPAETLQRSLLPMILRVYAELRADALKLAELEVANDALRTGARIALDRLRPTG